MTFVDRVCRACAGMAVAALIATVPQARAQEISETHLKAALAVVAAIHATDAYDNILPAAATKLKQELIVQNPDLEELISTTVDEKALALAGRRADLEREAAQSYARLFSEAELKDIASFYTSPSGKKLLDNGPGATRDINKAAQIWQNGITRDLAQEVGKQVNKVLGANADAAKAAADAAKAAAPADGEAPADGAAPADGGEAPADGEAPAQ